MNACEPETTSRAVPVTRTQPSTRTDRPLLSIRDLVVEFETAAGAVRVVDEVSYDVFAGETLGVVGESGSGKTVTVLAAMGLLPRRRLHAVHGQVLYDGRDLLTLPADELRALRGGDIAMVFQDPISALNPVQRIGDQIAEAVELHERIGSRAARSRAVELLGLVGVPQPTLRADQYPHQFSGGMCQRAMIAMAIANRPKVLIADEPTTAVDVSVQAQLLEALRVAQNETGAAIVLISHDLGVIAETADRLCVMYAGRAVESGTVSEVFARPRHPYTVGLLSCIPRLDRQMSTLDPIPGQPPDPGRLPSGCAFHPRCALGAGRKLCLERRPGPAEWSRAGRLSACHFAEEVPTGADGGPADSVTAAMVRTSESSVADSPAVDGPPMLRVAGLVKQFPIRKGVLSATRGWVHAVDDISFSIPAGQTLGLVGESGCGKSTTARLLIRLADPTSGSVMVGGTDVATAGRSTLRRVRRQVQMVFQDPYGSLNPTLSVGDNVAEPLRVAGGFSRARRMARAADLLSRVGLNANHATRYPHELSGGQRQRVAIARALAVQPELLLLDEPVSALDVSVQAQVLNLLNELKAEFGLAYLFVSHDLSVVKYMSDRVAVMYLGKIVEIGPAAEVFAAPAHPYTRALLASVPQPRPRQPGQEFRAPLRGEVPSPANPPSGCRFRTRCPLAAEVCAREEPALMIRSVATEGSEGHRMSMVACHFAGTPGAGG